jgi:hypothetical protein
MHGNIAPVDSAEHPSGVKKEIIKNHPPNIG